jgi:hypothetical protein
MGGLGAACPRPRAHHPGNRAVDALFCQQSQTLDFVISRCKMGAFRSAKSGGNKLVERGRNSRIRDRVLQFKGSCQGAG